MTIKTKLKPFFCYFGGKFRAVPHYPKPKYETIIEPFAGAAGYSTRYFDKQIILYEKDEKIYGIWDFLLKSQPKDIYELPIKIEHVNDIKGPQEAKWLIGLWINKPGPTPALTPSTWFKSGTRPNSHWGRVIRERIASQVPYIKHWVVHNKSYEECPNQQATWFIDPPYEGKSGKLYKQKISNYNKLGEWCKTRHGQTIVCEKDNADWLDFRPFRKIKSLGGPKGKKVSNEVIWTNCRS